MVNKTMNVFRQFTIVFALILLGCSEPQIHLSVVAPADGLSFSTLGVENLVINVLYPPLQADESLRFDCDALAYQDVERQVALSHMTQQINIAKGEKNSELTGLDRTRTKLFWLEGFNLQGAVVLAGCGVLEPRDVDATLRIETFASVSVEIGSFDPSLPIVYDADEGGEVPAPNCPVEEVCAFGSNTGLPCTEDKDCPSEIKVQLKIAEQVYAFGRNIRVRIVSGLVQDSPVCNTQQACEGGEQDGQSCSGLNDCRPMVLADKEEFVTSDANGEVIWDELKAPAGIAGPFILEVVAKWQSHAPLSYTFGVNLPKVDTFVTLCDASAFNTNDKAYGLFVGDFGPLGQPGLAFIYEDNEEKYDLLLTYFGGGQVDSNGSSSEELCSTSGDREEPCSTSGDKNELCFQTTYGAQVGPNLSAQPAIVTGRLPSAAKDILVGIRSGAWDQLEMVYDDPDNPTAIMMLPVTDSTAGVSALSQVFAADDCQNGKVMDELLLRVKSSESSEASLELKDLSGQDIQNGHPLQALTSGEADDLISSAKDIVYSGCIEASDAGTYRVLFEGERNLNVILSAHSGLAAATWNLVLSGGLTHSNAITGVYAEPAMIFGVRPLGSGLALVRSQLLLGDSVLEIQERDTDTIPFMPQRSFAQDFDGDGSLDIIAILETNFGVNPVIFYMIRGVKYKNQRIAGYVAQTGLKQSAMELLDINCDGVDEIVLLNSSKGGDASATVAIRGLRQGIDYSTLLASSACTFNDD